MLIKIYSEIDRVREREIEIERKEKKRGKWFGDFYFEFSIYFCKIGENGLFTKLMTLDWLQATELSVLKWITFIFCTFLVMVWKVNNTDNKWNICILLSV